MLPLARRGLHRVAAAGPPLAALPAEHSVFVSLATQPHANLALEEWLLQALAPAARPALLLWRNAPSVILGRTQNPWLEADLARLRARGVPLVRRRSGGGAVYHDLGNLNCTFLGPRPEHVPARNAALLARAVHRGPPGSRTCMREARANMAHPPHRAQPRASRCARRTAATSFSASASSRARPSASCVRWCSATRHGGRGGRRSRRGAGARQDAKMAYHHCTLLLRADLGELAAALHPAAAASMTGKGVPSVRSRVVNLGELTAAPLDDAALVAAIAAEFTAAHGLPPPPPRLPAFDPAAAPLAADPALAALAAEFAGWAWSFAQTPPFAVRHPVALPAGPAVRGASTLAVCSSGAALVCVFFFSSFLPHRSPAGDDRPFGLD
jgi:lipoate-protein ligase A